MPYIGKQPTPVPLSASDLNDDIVSLAKLASGTDGNLITYDASGNPVAVATGDDGQILTSAGAGQPCAFEAAAGGGGILQIKSANKTDTMSTSSDASPVYITGLTVSLTPASSSNKVFVHCTMSIGGASNMYGSVSCYRDIGGAGFSNLTAFIADTLPGSMAERLIPANEQGSDHPITYSYSFLDNPGTDSEVTYRTYACKEQHGTMWINRGGYTGNQRYNIGGISTITAYEIDSGAL